MKIATGLLAGFAVLAMAQVAQAAPPKVSGKYAYTSTSMCQALISQNKKPTGEITSVNPVNGGTIDAEVGYITFPATAASSGMATTTGRGFGGDAVRISSPGAAAPTGNVQVANSSNSGAFSFPTDTTFVFKGQTFQMSFANVAAGVAKTIHLVQRENVRCVGTIIFTK